MPYRLCLLVMIIPLLIDISVVLLKSLIENRFKSMVKLSLISVHFQVIIVFFPPLLVYQNGEEPKQNSSLNCAVLSGNILYVWYLP